MSLSVNLRSPEITSTYRAVLAGEIDWALYTYEKGTNDLKVQSTGSGGLEELEEEFSDGRIQYAFVRVIDPNSQLPKFVQINWCGDGVPEAKKGLFHTHASTVAQFLKGTHVVISARNEADVTPALIMSRVNNASGSKYSVHKESARKYEPIAPVGTAYTPVGKVDINELKKFAPRDVVQPVGSSYQPVRSELSSIRSIPVPPSASAPRAVLSRPSQSSSDWDDAPSAPTAPPSRASSRPPPVPNVSRPSPSQRTVSFGSTNPLPNKPAPVDRIAPNQPAYVPVQLGPPRKLVNPFEARQAEAAAATQSSPKPPVSGPGPKKLTWSERQALAKQQQEEEDAHSRNASIAAGVGAATVAAVAGAAVMPSALSTTEDEENQIATHTWQDSGPEPDVDDEVEYPAPPPPPPPPPPPVPPAVVAAAAAPEPIPAEAPPVPDQVDTVVEHTESLKISGGELRAIVIYPYEALESNEMDLLEGEPIGEIEQVDEGWWHGVGPSGKSGLFPANYVEIVDDAGANADDGVPPPPPPPPPPPATSAASIAREPSPEPQHDEDVVAVALYPYEAAEDNEISFNEGDHIVAIDTSVSEDWWMGTTAEGSVGLFPAAYVELQG